MTTLQDIDFETAEAQTPIIENFESVSPVAIFSHKPTTSGLTWSYYGGLFDGNTIADDDVTLTDDDDNYVVVERSSGVVSVSTATTNWNSASYARLYLVTAAAGLVTAVVDHRMDTNGLLLPGGGTGGSSRTTVTDLTSTTGDVTLDWNLGDYFRLPLTENIDTITFSNIPDGATLLLEIEQDSTPRTVAWPASVTWQGGTPGVVSTGSGDIDVVAFTTFDGGTTWRATLGQAYS